MKRIINYLSFLFIFFIFFSCKTDVDSVTSGLKTPLNNGTPINNNKARVEITKIEPKYRGATSAVDNSIFESVELTVLSAGDLLGLEVYSAYYGKKKSLVLPQVNVSVGEKILLHLRSGALGASYCNELGDDLAQSKAYCADDRSRDFWDFNNPYNAKSPARLEDTCDIVILEWQDNGEYADIVPYSKVSAGTYSDRCKPFVSLACELGFWDSEELSGAVSSEGVSVTKPMKKTGSAHTRASWIVSPDTFDPAIGGSATGDGTDSVIDSEETIIPLEITKIQPKFSSTGPIFEFIEVTARGSGNLKGYKLYSLGNGVNKAYTFPDFSIRIGEKITVHLRSLIGSADELGALLSLDTTYCSKDNERDFWDKTNCANSSGKFSSGASRLVDTGDIIILSSPNGTYCDVVPYAASSKSPWPNDTYTQVLLDAIERGFFEAAAPTTLYAVNASGATVSNPLVKTGSACCAASWTLGSTQSKSYDPADKDIDDPDTSLFDKDVSDEVDDGGLTGGGGVAGGDSFKDFGTPDEDGTIIYDKPIINSDADDPDTDISGDGTLLGYLPASFTFTCKNVIEYDFGPHAKQFQKNGYTLSKRDGINALITEIEPTYFSKDKQTKFYGEYFELYFKTGGNLSDLYLMSIHSGTKKDIKLSLPSVTIKDSDVVVIHLANKGAGCVSEVGPDLNLSTAPYSAPNARDIWLDIRNTSGNPNTDVLDNKLGALVLYDSGDCVMDYIIYFGDYDGGAFIDDKFVKLSDFAIGAGLWTPGHFRDSIEKAGVGFYITTSKNPCARYYYPVTKTFYTGHEAWWQNIEGGTPGAL